MKDKITFYSEDALLASLRELYRQKGFRRFKMRKFEEYDLYVQNKDFLTSGNIITFTDTNGKLMALKPDVTLSIVKNRTAPTPGYVERLYYHENVYRVSSRAGSYREIMQVGLECIGDIDHYTAAEVLTLAGESLSAIGTDWVLNVSHLGLLSMALETTRIPLEAQKQLLTAVAEKNLHGAWEICRAYGTDSHQFAPLEALMTAYGRPEEVKEKLTGVLKEEAWQTALDELFKTLSMVTGQSPVVDFSVVGNMKYYNGIVFRGYVKGIPLCVLSGGRYDRLLESAGSTSGAIGFALYLDLLEDLPHSRNNYDVDVLLLYDESTDPIRLQAETQDIYTQGKSASLQRTLPTQLTFEAVIDLRGAQS